MYLEIWNNDLYELQKRTGKSSSEALIFASQYEDRLFIVHDNCKLR